MARVKEDYRTLTGPQKAAIMLLSLGQDQSAKLFGMLEDDEIKELSQVMSGLGTIGSNIVERLFVDFADALSNTGSLVGSYESTERLLLKGLDKDRAALIMAEIRGPAGRTMWDKLTTCTKPCWPITSRTNTRKPWRWCFRKSNPTMRAVC